MVFRTLQISESFCEAKSLAAKMFLWFLCLCVLVVFWTFSFFLFPELILDFGGPYAKLCRGGWGVLG